MQQAEGNPLQIAIKRYGNKVLGLESSSEIYLEALPDLFDRRHLSFRFEIMPGNLNSSLASRLHKLGFVK